MRKLVLILLSVVFFASFSDAQTFGGGSGTEGSPYIISTLDHLVELRDAINANNNNYAGKYFKQTADIDMNVAPHNEGSGWDPIGNNNTGNINSWFTGIYDGDGHAINGLYINRSATDRVGLFGHANEAEFKNIAVLDHNISGRNSVGGLVGSISGDIYYTRGGTITNCSATGNLIGNQSVGGLVGSSFKLTVIDCHTTGNVTGYKWVGGLVGYIENPDDGDISKCYSTASVTGTDLIGGLIGDYQGFGATLSNCYSTGRVIGGDMEEYEYSGGLAGAILDVNITNCYSVGIASDGSPLVGQHEGRASNCYWNKDLYDGSTNDYAGAGKTTIQMKTQSTYKSWDFDAIWGMDAEINDGYPYLLSNTPPPDVPLPITLANITATYEVGRIILTWHTASETENAAFRIYRDGEMVAELEGAGTTSEPRSYSWTDQYVVPGRTYTYVLADVDLQGKETKHPEVEVEAKTVDVDLDYTIGNAYPNPFNPVTVVPLNLAKDVPVRAVLYDVRGHAVRELLNRDVPAGSHALKIDGANLSTGIYFVHIVVNVGAYRNTSQVQKIALMK